MAGTANGDAQQDRFGHLDARDGRRVMASVLSLVLVAVASVVGAAQNANAATSGILATARATVVSSQTVGPMAGTVEYDPTNVTSAGGQVTTSHIGVALGGGTGSRAFSIDLYSPSGSPFHLGSSSIGAPTGPDDELIEQSQSCGNVAYRVVDLASSGTAITRLDLQFRTDCQLLSDDVSTVYGELLLGEPSAAPAVVTATRSFTWPQTPVGTVSPGLLPVWIRNTGTAAITMGRPAVSGADAGDFGVVANTCRPTLAGHSSCQLTVRFLPHAAGARTASVAVTAGAATLSTALAGTGPAGRTLLRLNSGAGNWVGQGQSYLVTDAQTPMRVSFDSPEIFEGQIPNDASWIFSLRSGSELAVGSHQLTDATSGGYEFTLGGYGRGCTMASGTVTINQVSYANDQPQNIDFSFSASCGSTASNDTISGEIAYRATTPPIAASAPFLVRTGAAVHAGHSITDDPTGSPITLAVTTAGRAVLTADSATLWSSPAADATTDDRLAVLSNGQLALIRAGGTVLWATPAAGSGAFAEVQSDGNVVLYTAAYVPVWATGTAQPS